MDLVIKKLDKTLLNEYLHFFDDIAFCDNPSWSWCYCNHFHLLEKEVEAITTKEASRSCLVDRIHAGKHNGFLAFIDEEPVGWLNAGDKMNYARIMANEEIAHNVEEKVASLVCFVVDRNHRGKGVATALLNEACDHFKMNGYDSVEAYPLKSPKNEAENYHGPLNMFLSNGFNQSKELSNMLVVSKHLK